MTEKNRKFDEFTAKIKHKANTLKNVIKSLRLDEADRWNEEFIELKHKLQKNNSEILEDTPIYPLYEAIMKVLDETEFSQSDFENLSFREYNTMYELLRSMRIAATEINQMCYLLKESHNQAELKRAKEQKGIYPLKDRIVTAKARSKGNDL